MLMTLEALEARHGDSLLIHYGTSASPSLIVIDGGPSGVFNKRLKKRLTEIRNARSPHSPLPIRMVMISHMDDDHIRGILDWFEQLNDLREDGREVPHNILTLWHNSFDDLVGRNADVLLNSLETAARTAARTGSIPSGLPFSRASAAVVASVRQGRRLRELASALSLSVNEGFHKSAEDGINHLVMANETGDPATFDAGGALRFVVIGPSQSRIQDLHEEWGKQLEEMGVARPAALAEFMDKSVFNLASISVIAEAKLGRKKLRMLLTGDARGDDLLSGLSRANQLNRAGKIHVNLLKLPHHGSDRNVSTNFFRHVTADHYVVSADGKHDNPDLATFQMLLEARGGDEFDLYLTNPKPQAVIDFLKSQQRRSGRNFRLHIRHEEALSLSVHLGNEQL